MYIIFSNLIKALQLDISYFFKGPKKINFPLSMWLKTETMGHPMFRHN